MKRLKKITKTEHNDFIKKTKNDNKNFSKTSDIFAKELTRMKVL